MAQSATIDPPPVELPTDPVPPGLPHPPKLSSRQRAASSTRAAARIQVQEYREKRIKQEIGLARARLTATDATRPVTQQDVLDVSESLCRGLSPVQAALAHGLDPAHYAQALAADPALSRLQDAARAAWLDVQSRRVLEDGGPAAVQWLLERRHGWRVDSPTQVAVQVGVSIGPEVLERLGRMARAKSQVVDNQRPSD